MAITIDNEGRLFHSSSGYITHGYNSFSDFKRNMDRVLLPIMIHLSSRPYSPNRCDEYFSVDQDGFLWTVGDNYILGISYPNSEHPYPVKIDIRITDELKLPKLISTYTEQGLTFLIDQQNQLWVTGADSVNYFGGIRDPTWSEDCLYLILISGIKEVEDVMISHYFCHTDGQDGYIEYNILIRQRNKTSLMQIRERVDYDYRGQKIFLGGYHIIKNIPNLDVIPKKITYYSEKYSIVLGQDGKLYYLCFKSLLWTPIEHNIQNAYIHNLIGDAMNYIILADDKLYECDIYRTDLQNELKWKPYKFRFSVTQSVDPIIEFCLASNLIILLRNEVETTNYILVYCLSRLKP